MFCKYFNYYCYFFLLAERYLPLDDSTLTSSTYIMADVITADTLVTLVTSTASSILGGGSTVKVTAGAGSGSADAGNDGEGHVHIEPKNDEMMAAMLSTAQRMHYGASAVVGPIFVILGLMGNILSIIIWNRPHMTSSTGRYLTALVGTSPLFCL